MEENEEDVFRKLIQSVKPDTPAHDFTDLVMKMVQIETEKDQADEIALRSLINNQVLIEKPSKAFNRHVMRQIAPSKTKIEPIISKQAWYLIAASVAFSILLCFLIKEPQTAQSTSSALDLTLKHLSSKLESLPIMYAATVFGLGFLMVLDYVLRAASARKVIRI